MKVHYFYKITNKINGKYYLGVHTSKNPSHDNYWGSGPGIKAAVRKYGKENFVKDVIKTFSTTEEAFKYEEQHITLKEIQDPLCYNMQLGGLGGTPGAYIMYRESDKKRIRILPEEEQKYRALGFSRFRNVHSPETLKKMSESHKGHTLTEEQKDKKRAVVKNWVWLFDGTEEIRVPSENLESYLKEGWTRGRNPERGQKISRTLKKYNKAHGRPKRIYVCRGSEVLSILAKDAESYFEQGWTRGNGRTGKVMSEETRKKLSEANKGKPNATRGKRWIHRGYSEQKRVSPEDLNYWLEQGWVEGHSESYKAKVKATHLAKKS